MQITNQVRQWETFEYVLKGPSRGNPYVDVQLKAMFKHGNTEVCTSGFYDGDGRYIIRFTPYVKGRWEWRTTSDTSDLNGSAGSFDCIDAAEGVHGPVRVSDTHHFAYADGTRYIPVGTTCYVWTHQTKELIAATLKTLASAPFNKIRMCVFPKDYVYNKNDPDLYPFERNADGKFDHSRFSPAYFAHFEKLLKELQKLSIEADIILFHPYDRWGFSEMSARDDDFYLRYVVSRLCHFRNVWWSLANEFDFMKAKKTEDWDRFFQIVRDTDPYGHLRSVHNGAIYYDHSKPWVTHASIQSGEDMSLIIGARQHLCKPVVMDECVYEGNIPEGWGSLSGKGLVQRTWRTVISGGHPGCHGETFLDKDDVLWWSKGGVLKGESHTRFRFLRNIIESAPGRLNPSPGFSSWWYGALATDDEKVVLIYLGNHKPESIELNIRNGKAYDVEVINAWNMTIEKSPVKAAGACTIPLAGLRLTALRLTAG